MNPFFFYWTREQNRRKCMLLSIASDGRGFRDWTFAFMCAFLLADSVPRSLTCFPLGFVVNGSGPWFAQSRRLEALELLVVSPPHLALCPLNIFLSLYPYPSLLSSWLPRLLLKFNRLFSLAVSYYVLPSLKNLAKMLHIDLRNLPISPRVKRRSPLAFRPLHSVVSSYLPVFIAAICSGLITILLTIIPASHLHQPASVRSKLAYQSCALASVFFFQDLLWFQPFPSLTTQTFGNNFLYLFTHCTDSYLSPCLFCSSNEIVNSSSTGS